MIGSQWPLAGRAAFFALRLLVAVAATFPFWHFSSACFGDAPTARYSDDSSYYRDDLWPRQSINRTRPYVGDDPFERDSGIFAGTRFDRCQKSFPGLWTILGGLVSAAIIEALWRRARYDLWHKL